MKKFAKFLGAGVGFTMGGPIGALIGFAIGNMIDVFGTDENVTFQNGYVSSQTKAGDFEITLLVLSSYVIKSDGKIDKRELDYVRAYFVKMYGKERANSAFRLFNEIVKNSSVSLNQVCAQIKANLDHSSRLQLIHFLFGIALSDGQADKLEIDTIAKIAGYLNISLRDFESIKSMFIATTDAAYRILEIDKSATDQELKKAYRKMAKKYHPDKLESLGAEHRKGAEEKFIAVQEAYEKIVKERGL